MNYTLLLYFFMSLGGAIGTWEYMKERAKERATERKGEGKT